jgi:STE24 endopeptidase
MNDTDTTSELPPAQTAQRDPAEVQAYHRAKRFCRLVDIPISLIYWVLACWWLPLFVVWLAGIIGSAWLVLPVAALVLLGGRVVLDLPLDYYSGFVLEHRFDLSNQTLSQWFVFNLKSWLVGGVIIGVVLAGLYGLLWHGGPLWSVWAWVGLMVLAIGLAKIFPLIILPLFYPAKPLDRPTLTERLKALAGHTGMTITGVFDLALSKDTKKANAMLAGLGSSRRVYLSDTLLEAFSEDQIAVVFAHELGHHIRKHIYKGILLSAVVSSVMMALIHWRLDRFAGQTADWGLAVGALAQVMLVTFLWPLIISPVTNAISRHFERQSDSDALRLTDDPEAYRGAFELLGTMNLADPDPPRWEEIFFDDHPALKKRIAMADEYQKQSVD